MAPQQMKTQARNLLLLALGAAVGPLGCSDPDFVDAVVEAAPGVLVKNKDRLTKPLKWGECPDGFSGDCALLEVPVDWLDLGSESLEIMISRRVAKDPAKSKGQLWLLDGGPGSNCSGMTALMDMMWGSVLRDYDLYTIVHRGTYHSELLSCPKAQDEDSPAGNAIAQEEVAGCVAELRDQWGDKLESFRLSHAARDLSHAIRRTRKPNEDVFLYGISYGTLLAQRFAQIAPLQATGIMLDGILPPRNISYFDYDLQFDDVAERIAALCKEDSFCSSKWPGDPWKALLKLRDRIDEGHCESLDMSPAQLKTLTAQLLAGASTREDVFALLYRVQRCDDRDVAVVKHYFATLQAEQAKGMEEYDPRSFSMPLFYNIIFSEVMGGGDIDLPSVEQIESRCEASPFCPGYSVNARKVYDHWPAYAPDRFYASFAKFRTPVLAMSGSLDPQTPIEKARSIAKNFEGPAQRFVEFPYSPHVVLLNSEVESDSELNCAGQMVASFLKAPQEAVDDSCLQDLLGMAFDPDEDHARHYFDSESAWENEGELRGMSLRSIELDWDEVIRVMARANRRL